VDSRRLASTAPISFLAAAASASNTVDAGDVCGVSHPVAVILDLERLPRLLPTCKKETGQSTQTTATSRELHWPSLVSGTPPLVDYWGAQRHSIVVTCTLGFPYLGDELGPFSYTSKH
jgi:hypothetical protein